jgi:triosephosphate isomerase (TIM)
MERKKIVAGNWKMNTSLDEAVELVKGIQGLCKGSEHVEKIICPPFPYLRTIREMLVEEQTLFTGAQNCSEHEKGAYTGEVSAAMLRSVGCHYVIIGHSERRTYFNETNVQLSEKIRQALMNGLKIIFCFGEQHSDRKEEKHFEVIEKQLHGVLENFPPDKIKDLILAYEPVWAIGTGETATPEQAQEMHAYTRGVMKDIFSETIASSVSILYGGSCNAQNAAQLFACPDVDGGLIGGASLKAADFCKIITSF